jgi:hypothetical protein
MKPNVLPKIASLACLMLAFTIVADAQAPSTNLAPTAHASIAMPVDPPPGWKSDIWAGLRAECQNLADKYASGEAIDRSDFLKAEGCRRLNSIHVSPQAHSSITPAASSVPTPVPPQASSGFVPAAMSSPGAVGPFGTPVAGASATACPPSGQPPDVAAAVWHPIGCAGGLSGELWLAGEVTSTPNPSP